MKLERPHDRDAWGGTSSYQFIKLTSLPGNHDAVTPGNNTWQGRPAPTSYQLQKGLGVELSDRLLAHHVQGPGSDPLHYKGEGEGEREKSFGRRNETREVQF